MEHSPSSEANSHSDSQEIAFYGTQMFVMMSTKACHWPLSWARCIQSTSTSL